MNILVTGGSKGVGNAIVNKLAEKSGDHIYFTYLNSEAAASELEVKYPNVSKVQCDFSDENSLSSLVDKMEQWNIDVLINNAAVNPQKKHFHKLDEASLVRDFKTNIVSTITVTQAAIRIFRKKKSGKIITILSSAIIGKPAVGWSEYIAGKNYLLSLSKSWATENNRFNITSNCVSPSFMLTDFNQDVDERLVEEIISSHPLGKLILPAEVADAVAFLTTCSQHINGQNIVMNAAMDI
ncbi:SDR family NAD(P)-dependent oxidoreductase [Chitinophaga sp. CF418]|uniref:SDR family NAD(P)-dependent oxidoreductase n=1 Tax=Chitinophaga sp. CF418 TaxID=1855287 RepID=UPI00091D30C7|nr:SDR family oxidoreductase [Chitinophaga sp. CF418]SHM13869.1 3-oxoacyl-[acyl-carrier protein] reductase [Chitinophaga sp. CF418]